MDNSNKNSYVKSPSKHAKNTPSGLSKNLAESGKAKKRKRRTSKESNLNVSNLCIDVDSNLYMKRSAKGKPYRRKSLEDLRHHFPSVKSPKDTLKSIQELDSDYSQRKSRRKSPNRHKGGFLNNIVEVRLFGSHYGYSMDCVKALEFSSAYEADVSHHESIKYQIFSSQI